MERTRSLLVTVDLLNIKQHKRMLIFKETLSTAKLT
ncbi:Transcriptional repressor scratch 1, partial [Araneus ventricosus]